MEDDRRFELHFVARYEPTNKVWGWVTFPSDRYDCAYAFWSVIGKTISFKKHRLYGPRGVGSRTMQVLETAKLENKYVKISEEELLELWPDFRESFSNRYTFMQLANGFEQE